MDGPHEIAGTIGEARGAAGSERFHAGVDVRIDEGTAVRAVRDGTVMSPVSTGDVRHAERVAPAGLGELRPRPCRT